MKQHRFEVIRWLGDRGQPVERFGVVEIDERGPILRGGPFPEGAAKREVDRLERAAPKVRYDQR